MKLACERCNRIINKTFDEYEIINRHLEGSNEEHFVLCTKCTNELDDFIYNFQAEQLKEQK